MTYSKSEAHSDSVVPICRLKLYVIKIKGYLRVKKYSFTKNWVLLAIFHISTVLIANFQVF